jgi:hypothetical protein
LWIRSGKPIIYNSWQRKRCSSVNTSSDKHSLHRVDNSRKTGFHVSISYNAPLKYRQICRVQLTRFS